MSREPGLAGFRDHFSRDSAAYAKFRPRYPAALFEWLATLPARRELAWDCATGNGQAATMLAEHFPLVVASDASIAQLRAAARAPRVRYLSAFGETSALAARRVDLITIAQAYHWLNGPRFHAEVDRVAAPGAALAVWGYARPKAAPAIEASIAHFHQVTVGPYWPTERRLVDEGYRGFVIPIEEVPAPPLAIEAELTLPQLLGYLRTWSAVGRYLAANGRDPVEALAGELVEYWGDPAAPQRIVWPLFVRAGRWQGPAGQSSSTKVTFRATR